MRRVIAAVEAGSATLALMMRASASSTLSVQVATVQVGARMRTVRLACVGLGAVRAVHGGNSSAHCAKYLDP